MQTTQYKYTGDCVVQVRTVLLSSNFSSSTRGVKQFLRVFHNHTMLTPYLLTPMFGTSRGLQDLCW